MGFVSYMVFGAFS